MSSRMLRLVAYHDWISWGVCQWSSWKRYTDLHISPSIFPGVDMPAKTNFLHSWGWGHFLEMTAKSVCLPWETGDVVAGKNELFALLIHWQKLLFRMFTDLKPIFCLSRNSSKDELCHSWIIFFSDHGEYQRAQIFLLRFPLFPSVPGHALALLLVVHPEADRKCYEDTVAIIEHHNAHRFWWDSRVSESLFLPSLQWWIAPPQNELQESQSPFPEHSEGSPVVCLVACHVVCHVRLTYLQGNMPFSPYILLQKIGRHLRSRTGHDCEQWY